MTSDQGFLILLVFSAGLGAAGGATFGLSAFFDGKLRTLTRELQELRQQQRDDRHLIGFLSRKLGIEPGTLNIDARGDVTVTGDVVGGGKRGG